MDNLLDKYITGPINDFIARNYVDPLKDQANKFLGISYEDLWLVCIALIMFGLLVQSIGLKSQGKKVSGWGLIGAVAMFILKLAYGK